MPKTNALPTYTLLDDEADSPADLVAALHAAHTAASAVPVIKPSTDGETEIVSPETPRWFSIKSA